MRGMHDIVFTYYSVYGQLSVVVLVELKLMSFLVLEPCCYSSLTGLNSVKVSLVWLRLNLILVCQFGVVNIGRPNKTGIFREVWS